MQQKLCSRGSGSFLLQRNSQACGAIADSITSCDLPFRCPRCGEQVRFHSLASLRAHLEYRHSYRSPDVVSSGFSITGKLPDPQSAAIPWNDMSLPTRRGQQSARRPPHVRSLSDSRDSSFFYPYSSVRRRTQSVGVGTQAEEEGGTEDEDVGGEEDDGEAGGRNEEDIKMSPKTSDTSHHHLNHHYLPFPPSDPLEPRPDPDLDLDPEPDLVGAFRFSY